MNQKTLSTPNPEEANTENIVSETQTKEDKIENLKEALKDPTDQNDNLKSEQRPRKISQSKNADDQFVSISGNIEEEKKEEEKEDTLAKFKGL